MTMNNYKINNKYILTIPTEVKLSKNYDINEFLNNFLYHNTNYFKNLVDNDYTSCPTGDYTYGKDQGLLPGIHYECGPHKWGSIGMLNKMLKKGLVTIIKDHKNNCYCLDATPKLVTKILKAVNKYLGKC